MRAAWLPYFDNVNVIIFLSPVSVFDQRLEEDPKVNRLEDSIILWTSICSSKLLSKTQLILFLNKCDLLRRKLKRGVKVNQYLPSFGDRPNEVITVVKYLREKFKDIQKQHSPEHRSVYIYPTTVTVIIPCPYESDYSTWSRLCEGHNRDCNDAGDHPETGAVSSWPHTTTPNPP
ncbi:hypothetical protein NLJ89_g8458 [Agrocybe chaxingu]|uniref:G protein alpha subunit n=1 Tax=Agrocybe chaxingu TaxID=84603 RepID=A0A9W8MS54_9AGAR|nr:hypothetical protein NLJ89_g8458 [Agrocybe chaxingu]